MTSRSAHDSEALPDRQALATILQTLKKHNLKATEETLLKEMKMSDPSATGHASASTASQPRLSDAEPAKYESSYASPEATPPSSSPPPLYSFPLTATKTPQSAPPPTTSTNPPPTFFIPQEEEVEEEDCKEEKLTACNSDDDMEQEDDDDVELLTIDQRQDHLRSESSTPVDTDYQSPSSWPGTVNAKFAPKLSPTLLPFSFKPSFVPVTAFDKTQVRVVDNKKPLWFTSSTQPTTNTVASKPTLISPTHHLPLNSMIAGVSPSTNSSPTKVPLAAAPFVYQLAATSQGFATLRQPILATAPILTVLPTPGLVRHTPTGSPQKVQPLQTFGMPIFAQQATAVTPPSSKVLSTPPLPSHLPRQTSFEELGKNMTPVRTCSVSSSTSPVHFSAVAEPTTGQTLTSPMIEHMSVSSTGRTSPPKTLASIPPSELTQQHLELKAFAEEFKTKRIQLGYTQGSVGQSLADKGFSNFAQSTISRFEQMQLSATNAAAIKQVLEKWLHEAECPSSVDSTNNVPPMMAGRKRKKRAVFTAQTRGALEEFFKQNPRPNRQIIEAISQQLDLLPEEVRVWFCNKRQKEKQNEGVPIISSSNSGYSFEKDTCFSTSSSGANSPSSLYDSSTATKFGSPSPKTSFTIEELSKSSTATSSIPAANSINFTSTPGIYPMLISSHHRPAMAHFLGAPAVAQTKA